MIKEKIDYASPFTLCKQAFINSAVCQLLLKDPFRQNGNDVNSRRLLSKSNMLFPSKSAKIKKQGSIQEGCVPPTC